MNGHSQFNCLDYRRAKLADPFRLPPAARDHEADCALCQSFGRRVDTQEAHLIRALAVPVPDGLADRILLGVQGRRRPWRLMALAASLVLSVSVGFQFWREGPRHDYARFAIEHVLHEPESFTDHRLADPGQFRQVLAQFGAELKAPVGKIRYMKLCPVPEGTGWHIVMETEYGLATLLLIPGQHPRLTHLEASLKGYSAMAIPAGQGYFAVVMDSPQSVTAVTRMLQERVRWKT